MFILLFCIWYFKVVFYLLLLFRSVLVFFIFRVDLLELILVCVCLWELFKCDCFEFRFLVWFDLNDIVYEWWELNGDDLEILV